MATEYHLLTCLGRDGLTITAATSDVITRAAHGMRAGHPVRFTNSGGSLPGGLAANTTYYVSATDLLAGSFKVSATNGGAVVDITSTGSGTNKVIGEYWATLPATDPGNGGNYKARYGSVGSEFVYPTLASWEANRHTIATFDTDLDVVLEVQGNWTDTTYLSTEAFNGKGFRSFTLHSKINGLVDSLSFHRGVNLGGWVNNCGSWGYPLYITNQPDVTIEGLQFIASGSIGVLSGSVNTTLINVIITAPTGYTISGTAGGFTAINCIALNCVTAGFYSDSGQPCTKIIFCMAAGCGIGFKQYVWEYGYSNDYFKGCIAVGCTVNWHLVPATIRHIRRISAKYNLGGSSDKKVVTFLNATDEISLTAHGFSKNQPIRFLDNGSGVAPTGLSLNTLYYTRTVTNANAFTLTATVDGTTNISFSDDGGGSIYISIVYDTDITAGLGTVAGHLNISTGTPFRNYSGIDYYPAAAVGDVYTPHSDALQVAKVPISASDDLPKYDIVYAVRPNYRPGGGDQHATAGPFEFDYGNGFAPASGVLTITANASLSGAEIRIYDFNLVDGSYGTELSGTESNGSSTYSYSSLIGNTVVIQIMQSGYCESVTQYTYANATATLNIILQAETNA